MRILNSVIQATLIIIVGLGLIAMNTQQESIFRGSRSNSEALGIDAKKIIDQKIDYDQEIDSPEYSTCGKIYSNGSLNSRQPVTRIDAGRLIAESKRDISQLEPDLLLVKGDAVFIRGRINWSLQRENGNQLATGIRGKGEPCLDSEKQLLINFSHNGLMQGFDLNNGNEKFFATLFMANDFYRSYVNRIRDQIIVGGYELPLSGGSESPHVPEIAAVETWKLPKLSTDRTPQEIPEFYIDPIVLGTPEVLIASYSDTIVVTENQRILFATQSLSVYSAIHINCEPVAMSVDGAGWVHLVCKVNNSLELWVLNQQGQRKLKIALPKVEEVDSIQPPIIGYDHTVYLIFDDKLMRVSIDGNSEIVPIPDFVGAITTVDNMLLIATKTELKSLLKNRGMESLMSFKGEEIISAPQFSDDGRLWLATDKNIYIYANAWKMVVSKPKDDSVDSLENLEPLPTFPELPDLPDD